jgi:hypothetical protein
VSKIGVASPVVPLRVLKYTVLMPGTASINHAFEVMYGSQSVYVEPLFEKHISVAPTALKVKVTIVLLVSSAPSLMEMDKSEGSATYKISSVTFTAASIVPLRALKYTVLRPGISLSTHAFEVLYDSQSV